MATLQAILKGERDRYKLAALADVRIKATQEEVARSLEGNWRQELLFILQQELDLYHIYQQQITQCDVALHTHLQTLEGKAEFQASCLRRRPTKKLATMLPLCLICEANSTESAGPT